MILPHMLSMPLNLSQSSGDIWVGALGLRQVRVDAEDVWPFRLRVRINVK